MVFYLIIKNHHLGAFLEPPRRLPGVSPGTPRALPRVSLGPSWPSPAPPPGPRQGLPRASLKPPLGLPKESEKGHYFNEFHEFELILFNSKRLREAQTRRHQIGSFPCGNAGAKMPGRVGPGRVGPGRVGPGRDGNGNSQTSPFQTRPGKKYAVRANPSLRYMAPM